jgi:hypothetical protein
VCCRCCRCFPAPLLDLSGQALGLDDEALAERAMDALEHEAERVQAALAAAASRLPRFDSQEALDRRNRAIWARLWRSHHLERGLSASAIPPTPPIGRQYLATLTAGGGEPACSSTTDVPAKRASEAPIEAEPGSAMPRLAWAIGELIDSTLEARDDQLREYLAAAAPPPAPPPVVRFEPRINVHIPEQKPPTVRVVPPEVRVEIPAPPPRSIRVEEDRDGTRRYVTEEITEEEQ